MRSRSAANARKSRHYNLKKNSKTDTISIVSKYSVIIGRRSAPVRTKERSEAARRACSSVRCASLRSLDRRAAWICSTARARPRKLIDQDCAWGLRDCLVSGYFLWRRSGREGRGAARRAAVLPRRGATTENQNRTQGRVREQKRIFGDWGKLGK